MGKDEESILKEKYEKATGGNPKIIEGVYQEIDGKKILTLKIEKTSIELLSREKREAMEQKLGEQELYLHELLQGYSPFVYVCDGGA
jgi:hypothetical protein